MSSSMETEEELRREESPAAECLYKTKLIEFLGRTTPVILQNDNGPCPLLAICNVLLLKNSLNMSADTTEVSQEKLLSLVAERLIDSNSNVNDKDAGFVQNQEQNIADAIDLLPRLATGIDVNIKFRRIDDFEFTRECAIFDLLDIPLYHGWIVDAQDHDTVDAIGAKSYNALMGELVALDTRNIDEDSKINLEEDSVDFAAATTATLGVPSPCLSRGVSFDESPRLGLDNQKFRKGDIEEEVELMRILQLSKADTSTSADDSVINTCEDNVSICTDGITSASKFMPGDVGGLTTTAANTNQQPELSLLDDIHGPESTEALSVSLVTVDNNMEQAAAESAEDSVSNNVVEKEGFTKSFENKKSEAASLNENHKRLIGQEEQGGVPSISTLDLSKPSDSHSASDTTGSSTLHGATEVSDSPSGRGQTVDVPETLSSNSSEPIYEGEECILDSGTMICEGREPVYEGEEVVLAEQAHKGSTGDANLSSRNGISVKEGELIRNFLRSSASQLTIYGLFCLQDGLKERELCVFFRNNHFSTMFKIDGELYLLATDQGYINQPDLVWEKLNEVNGDTQYMTGAFKEFKVESHAGGAWDEHNALTDTADYLAGMDQSGETGSNFSSDLQLAIALQQQEFEQQSQPPLQKPQRPSPQPSTSGSSGLVTGPQAPRSSRTSFSSTTPTKHDSRSKEKCTLM